MRITGNPSVAQVLEAADSARALMNAVSDEIAPDVSWQIAGVSLRCDGCGVPGPLADDRPGWKNDGKFDWCPTCVANGVSTPLAF